MVGMQMELFLYSRHRVSRIHPFWFPFVARDFRKPPVGWGFRKMQELEDADLDRDIDDRPGFLVRKGNVRYFGNVPYPLEA
jgi:hypothetical protein